MATSLHHRRRVIAANQAAASAAASVKPAAVPSAPVTPAAPAVLEPSRTMRAKLRVVLVDPIPAAGERLQFAAVAKSDGYPEDGSDENNTFARWTPAASLEMYVTNPALFGRIKQGQTFYVDFIEAEPASAAVTESPAAQ